MATQVLGIERGSSGRVASFLNGYLFSPNVDFLVSHIQLKKKKKVIHRGQTACISEFENS